MLPHTDIRFTLAVPAVSVLPHLGIALHGAFGKALRDQVCVMGPRQPCVDCPLVSHCPYPRVCQERPREGNVPWTPGYVFEWDAGHEGGVTVTLRVFGDLQKVVDVLERALMRMRLCINPGERPVAITDIDSTEQVDVAFNSEPMPSRMKIHLATPLHLKRHGQSLHEPDLRALADTAQRRMSSMNRHYGTNTVHGMEPVATGTISGHTTAWKSMARFSHRQSADHPVCGLTGSVQVEGSDSEFYRLLKIAELTHIGKGVSFGLGRIRVEPLE